MEKTNRTFRRRDFLGLLASVLAASAADASIESCSIVKGVFAGAIDKNDIPALLQRLDASTDAIINEPLFGRDVEKCRRMKLSPFLMKETLITMLTVGMYKNLSMEDQKDPRIQAFLLKKQPVVDRAVLGMATYLEHAVKNKNSVLKNRLAHSSEKLLRFQVKLTEAAQKQGLPQNRIDHFNALFNQILWRLTNQEPSMLLDDCITMVDKASWKFGISPDGRRTLCTQWSSLDSFYGESEERYASVGVSDAGLSSGTFIAAPGVMAASNTDPSGEKKNGSIGYWCMGIGSFAIITGIGLVASRDQKSIGYGLVFGITGGALLLIVGIILAILGI